MKAGAVIIEGHVQGLSNVRSLGELGIPVFVVDVTHNIAQHSKYCTKHFICPDFQSDLFIPFLINLAQQEGLINWLIMASNDHIVEQLSKNYEQLSPYYVMLVPSTDILDKIIDKRLLNKEAEKCGTHHPATLDKISLEEVEKLRFPVLLKGSKGLSFYKKTHQKAIQLNNFEEAKQALDSFKFVLDDNDYMIQELIPSEKTDKVISFTCFAVNGEIMTYWVGQKLREHPLKYGTATYAQSIKMPELLLEAKPLIKQLSYTGICEIEFLRDKRDGVFKLIEINPRTWLWVGLAKACGIDYAKISYQFAHNIENNFPDGYQYDLKWVNRLTDFVYSFKGILLGHISIRDFIKSLSGEKCYAIWSSKDPVPGLLFPFMAIHIARTRR